LAGRVSWDVFEAVARFLGELSERLGSSSVTANLVEGLFRTLGYEWRVFSVPGGFAVPVSFDGRDALAVLRAGPVVFKAFLVTEDDIYYEYLSNVLKERVEPVAEVFLPERASDLGVLARQVAVVLEACDAVGSCTVLGELMARLGMRGKYIFTGDSLVLPVKVGSDLSFLYFRRSVSVGMWTWELVPASTGFGGFLKRRFEESGISLDTPLVFRKGG